MSIQQDSAGNRFVENELPGGGMVRVTYIEEGWAGQGGVRIQMRDPDGRLLLGPEIPVNQIGDVVSGVINLLKE